MCVRINCTKGLQCVCTWVHCMNQGTCHLHWQISRRTFQYESAFQALENPHYNNILLCVPTDSHTPNASNCGCYNKIMAAMCSSTGYEILTSSRVVRRIGCYFQFFNNLTLPNYLSTCVSGYHKEVENVSGYVIGR